MACFIFQLLVRLPQRFSISVSFVLCRRSTLLFIVIYKLVGNICEEFRNFASIFIFVIWATSKESSCFIPFSAKRLIGEFSPQFSQSPKKASNQIANYQQFIVLYKRVQFGFKTYNANDDWLGDRTRRRHAVSIFGAHNKVIANACR